MQPDTRPDDTPTLRHWIIAPIALATLIFGVPAFVEAATGWVLG